VQRILLAAAAAWLSLLVPRAEYRALFAPAGARGHAYDFYVATANLESVLRTLTTDPSVLHPPGAWQPAALLPADAFGETGAYDRAKLIRLYGATRAMVARGPRADSSTALAANRPTESWTLISPYPSLDLTRLEPGTLVIVLHLP
jgi:hypothetical protein